MPLENSELENLLLETPKLMTALSLQLIAREQAIEKTEKDIKRIELGYLRTISEETGEDGKKKYTNEQARNAALLEKTAKDKEYDRLTLELSDLEAEIAKVKLNFAEQTNLFSAYRSIANLRAK